MNETDGTLEKKARMFELKDFIPIFGALNLISRESRLTPLKYSLAAGMLLIYEAALFTTPVVYFGSEYLYR